MDDNRYLPIGNVNMFPVSYNVPHETYNFRQLSEINITKLLTSFTDKKSFVISCDTRDENCYNMEFIIEGHYFNTKIPTAVLDTFEPDGIVYATILMGTSPTKHNGSYPEHHFLVVGPSSHYDLYPDRSDITVANYMDKLSFMGLQFTSGTTLKADGSNDITRSDVVVPTGFFTEVDGSSNRIQFHVTPISLILLQFNGTTWSVPLESREKFYADSFTFTVDGGDLTQL